MEWTPEDSAAACIEGWDIFYSARAEDHEYDLQKIDEPELYEEENGVTGVRIWEDDADVWVFVRDTSSKLHQKALDYLAEKSPDEYASIMTWNA
jgi:hypothetical protein